MLPVGAPLYIPLAACAYRRFSAPRARNAAVPRPALPGVSETAPLDARADKPPVAVAFSGSRHGHPVERPGFRD